MSLGVEVETGFDATLLGSRANVEFTIYEKRISDLLLTRALAPVTGFGTQVFNGGVMRTRGLEVGLSVLPVQTGSVQWNARFNFFMSRSKILELPVPPFRNSTRAKYGTLEIAGQQRPIVVDGVLFTSGKLDASYERFIERRLREEFGFVGSPIHLEQRPRKKGRR